MTQEASLRCVVRQKNVRSLLKGTLLKFTSGFLIRDLIESVYVPKGPIPIGEVLYSIYLSGLRSSKPYKSQS